MLRLLVLSSVVMFPAVEATAYESTVYQRPLVKCASCKLIDVRVDALLNDISISRDYIACAQSAIDWMIYRASWQYQVLYDAYLTPAEMADVVRLLEEYRALQKQERQNITQWLDDIRSLKRIASLCRNCPIPQLVVFPN